MWHFISETISEHVGYDFICNDIRPVANGDSHSAYKISDGRTRYFVKINERCQLANFESESQGLEHLEDTHLFRVPHHICHGTVQDHSFLVLEHIRMQSGDEQSWYDFGCKLAQLHLLECQEMYGWQEDNYIGQTPQKNRWHKKWSQFFAEQRIGFMLQLLAERGQNLVDIDTAVESVKRLLAGHNPKASMLHGDLWQGNVGFNKHQPVLFDPAFYFGDREADLAMTELFNRFPRHFYQGYEEVWPLEQGYQYRKTVYQLYHLLNHALLFGGQYLHSAQATLRHLDS